MSTITKNREFLLSWNNRYPLDYSYRKKYNIPFGSAQHRAISQIDVYLDWLEEKIHAEIKDEALNIIDREKQFEKGKWLREEVVSQEDEDALFAKLDVTEINNSSIQLID